MYLFLSDSSLDSATPIIFIASAGIGTASASASSIANFAEEIVRHHVSIPPKTPLPYPYLWGSYGFALVLSLAVGRLVSCVVERCVPRKERSR